MQLERRTGHIINVLCEHDYTEKLSHSIWYLNLEVQ